MERNDRRTTEGLPFILGLAAGVLILLSTIMSISITQAYMDAIAASGGLMAAAVGGTSTLTTVGGVIGFLINPGIFLILLLVGKNQPKRGKTFAIVWIVISVLGLLGGIYSMVTNGKSMAQLAELTGVAAPAGLTLVSVIGFLGYGCVLASCITFLQKFQMLPQDASQNVNGDLPSSQD